MYITLELSIIILFTLGMPVIAYFIIFPKNYKNLEEESNVRKIKERWTLYLTTYFPAIFVSFLYGFLGPPPLDGLFGVYKASALENRIGDVALLLAPLVPLLAAATSTYHMFRKEKSKWWLKLLIIIISVVMSVITVISATIMFWGIKDNFW